jgi:hypothetical protein
MHAAEEPVIELTMHPHAKPKCASGYALIARDSPCIDPNRG